MVYPTVYTCTLSAEGLGRIFAMFQATLGCIVCSPWDVLSVQWQTAINNRFCCLNKTKTKRGFFEKTWKLETKMAS